MAVAHTIINVGRFGDHGFVPHYDAPRITHVYQIRNLVNGKTYIGITSIGVRDRLWQHKGHATAGRDGLLYNAMRKHGTDMFRASALCVCVNVRAAMAEERRLIATLRPDYNMTGGGEGVWGYVSTPEIRARIAASKKGKRGARPRQWTPWGLEALRLSGARGRGKKQSHERAELSRAALEEARKARPPKPIRCVETGEIFSSQYAASAAIGTSQGNISIAIKTGGKTKGRSFVLAESVSQ